ncbi:hypothetical protein SEA_ZOOMAN_46 [Microbacterium phage Zooman]|nr:hypothetical protein SEA_ZOOMAN_46 [Microbacterium phage Zooman]
MIDRVKLEMILDGLLKEVQRGRYAEAGYNDHFNDGLYAYQEALEEAGLVADSVEYEYGIRVKLSEESHGMNVFVEQPMPNEQAALSYQDDGVNITAVRRVKTEWETF